MVTFDVRNEGAEEITEIVFADAYGEDGYEQASKIKYYIGPDDATYILVEGARVDCVVVNNKNHALDLIKALNKAIELGWVK